MAKHVKCDKHANMNVGCTEVHREFKLVEKIGEKSLVNLATWIMRFGSENQVAFVKGQLNSL